MSGLRWTIAALLALAPTAAWASDDPQQWTTLQATVVLDDHWRLQEEAVFRFSDAREGLYEVESNTLVGYQLHKKGDFAVTLWAGYTHDPQYVGGVFTTMERRAREQIVFDKFAKLLGGSLTGRLRIETRWRDGTPGTGWRLRPYLRFDRPFTSHTKTALVLSHESFVDFNKVSFQTVGGEERMRNLIAISTPLDKHTTAEFGYLNQHGFAAGEDTNDHVVHVQLSFRFEAK